MNRAEKLLLMLVDYAINDSGIPTELNDKIEKYFLIKFNKTCEQLISESKT
jgi:hypothetical protein